MKPDKKSELKKYIKLAGNALSALSVIFILSALCRTDFDWSAVTDWRSFLCVCLLGTALKTFTVFLSGSAWYLWLEFFSKKRSRSVEMYTKALRVYAKANIGKYLPGNVMHYVERNLFAKDLELTQKQIAAASLVEVAALVMAAFFIGIVMSYSSLCSALAVIMEQQGVRIAAAALAGAGICAAAAVPAVLLYRQRLHLDKHQILEFGKVLGISLAAYAAVLLILGMILVLVYWYWAGAPSAALAAQMTAAYVTAWVLGFIVPGAPGGIGVRELVLTLLLSPVIGREQIVALGVLHRLITVAGDFAAYVLRQRIGVRMTG